MRTLPILTSPPMCLPSQRSWPIDTQEGVGLSEPLTLHDRMLIGSGLDRVCVGNYRYRHCQVTVLRLTAQVCGSTCGSRGLAHFPSIGQEVRASHAAELSALPWAHDLNTALRPSSQTLCQAVSSIAAAVLEAHSGGTCTTSSIARLVDSLTLRLLFLRLTDHVSFSLLP